MVACNQQNMGICRDMMPLMPKLVAVMADTMMSCWIFSGTIFSDKLLVCQKASPCFSACFMFPIPKWNCETHPREVMEKSGAHRSKTKRPNRRYLGKVPYSLTHQYSLVSLGMIITIVLTEKSVPTCRVYPGIYVLPCSQWPDLYRHVHAYAHTHIYIHTYMHTYMNIYI